MSRRNLGTLFVVLLIALIVVQVARVHIVHVSQRNLRDAVAVVTQAETDYKASVSELTEARQKHLAFYLTKFTTDVADAEIAAAKDAISKATLAKKPRLRNQFAKEAREHTARVKLNCGWHDEIALLNQALACYKQEPAKLMQLINQQEALAKSYEGQGYYSMHFAESRKTNGLARGNYNKAQSLSTRIFQQNMPDYRTAYISCLEGEKLCAEVGRQARIAPEMHQANIQRIAGFTSRYSLVTSRYNRAAVAAQNLERYPRYRMKSEIAASYGRLAEAISAWKEAQGLDSMQAQRFDAAKASLDRSYSLLDNATRDFDRAESNWAQVQNAINGIPGQRSAARSAINGARSYASEWSENDQSNANNLINQAEQQFRNGQGYEDSDPPASISAYSNATVLGEQAKNAVDDVDHTPPPSSNWSDDDSSSSSSSGGSSYDSGGSSSGYDGGGSSYDSGSSSSSSYDSGPSGSYDSGPSGSYDGGGL